MTRFALAALFCALGGAAPALDLSDQVSKYLENEVKPWINAPMLVAAVVAQNERSAGLDADAILDLDQAWRGEIGADDAPLITSVVASRVSEYLRRKMQDSAGLIREVIVMDAQGLNVAVSEVTSDYWQGDEAKYRQTYLAGPDALHVAEVEFDESTQTYMVQASFTLVHPADGAPIGAITIGLDAEAFM